VDTGWRRHRRRQHDGVRVHNSVTFSTELNRRRLSELKKQELMFFSGSFAVNDSFN
jgi:hypothetical protein